MDEIRSWLWPPSLKGNVTGSVNESRAHDLGLHLLLSSRTGRMRTEGSRGREAQLANVSRPHRVHPSWATAVAHECWNTNRENFDKVCLTCRVWWPIYFSAAHMLSWAETHPGWPRTSCNLRWAPFDVLIDLCYWIEARSASDVPVGGVPPPAHKSIFSCMQCTLGYSI